jgi:hypothetical protein
VGFGEAAGGNAGRPLLSGESNLTIEYVIIGVYLLVLISLGAIFGRFNKDSDDYFKSGSKGTWWQVGMRTTRQTPIMCLVPERGGAEQTYLPTSEQLWDKFYMEAPARRRRCVGRSRIDKRA